MQLVTKRQLEIWNPDPEDKEALIEYRPAESLDDDIAQAAAVQYGKLVLSADAQIMTDLGFAAPDQESLLGELISHIDDFKAHATFFYAIALAERLISRFEGFTDEGGKSLKACRRSFAVFLRDPDFQDEWLRRARKRIHALTSAGNA